MKPVSNSMQIPKMYVNNTSFGININKIIRKKRHSNNYIKHQFIFKQVDLLPNKPTQETSFSNRTIDNNHRKNVN